MTCARCHGLSVKEPFGKRGHWWWRCLSCGDLVDAIILRNRAEQEAFVAERTAARERDIKEWSAWMAKVPVAGLAASWQ